MTRRAPSDPLELSLEESQRLGFVRERQATDGFRISVYLNDRFGDNIHVGLGVYPSWNGEPDKLEFRLSVATRNGVTSCRDVASLHAPYTRVDVDRHGEGLGGEVVLWQMPETKAIYHLSGANDFLCNVVVKDTDHLRRVAVSGFTSLPEVLHIETSLIFEHRSKPTYPNLVDAPS